MINGMGRRFLFSGLVLLSGVARALPQITVEKINGFEVHFVDIGRGDTFGASYQIPLGTLSESGRFMGRAHLLEHVMHNGSKAYPGKKAFDQLLKPIGVNTNAYTSYARTFYFASGTEREAEPLLKVFLAALGGLDWNQESFANERQVVIDEIVSEGMPKDDRAFQQMMFTHLLDPRHPWAHAPLGDLQSLSALSLNDVKELYYANYKPENIYVTVQGNFSDAKFLGQVKAWTKQALLAAKISQDPQAYKLSAQSLVKSRAPSFFNDPSSPTEGEKRLYIQSDNMKESLVLFEVDLKEYQGKPETLDALVAYLNLQAPGTFLHKLKTENGWTTDAGFYLDRIGNNVHMYFGSSLTDSGVEHVTEINETMLQALRGVQKSGPDTSALKMLKDSVKSGLDRAAYSVPNFIQTYTDFREGGRTMEQQLASLQSVTAQDVKLAANLIHPARALYMSMGPEVSEMDFDPMFNRKYKLEDNRAALRKYAATIESDVVPKFIPVLTAVQLKPAGPKSEIKVFEQSKAEPFLKQRMTLDFRDDLPDTAVSATFHLEPKSSSELIAADLVLSAFNERFSGQLNYLNFKYQVAPASGRATNILTFTSSGEDTNSLGALEWMLRELATFEPTRGELERARQSYANDANQAYVSAFSAQVALWEMVSHVDPLYLTRLQSRDLARSLDIDQVQKQWLRLRGASNKEYVMVGPFGSADIARLESAAENLSPGVLDDVTTQSLWTRSQWVEQTRSFQQPQKEKISASFGVVRAYRGPKIQNIQESVAFDALSSFLEAKVKGYNRDDLGLGYVHGALLRPLDKINTHLVLLGQADAPDKLKLTVEGWEHVLSELKAGKYKDSEIQDAISDVLNSLAQKSTSAGALLSNYSGAQASRFDALAKEKLITALQSLTPGDVKAVAEKFLFSANVTSIQLTSGDCENLLLVKKP